MNAPGEPKSGMSTGLIILIVAGVIVVVAVGAVGIFAALGIYGARRYISKAKEAEGMASVQMLALGIVRCSEENALEGKSERLPETAPAVPASLADVSGRKYMSAPGDWGDPAYTCASFSMVSPQYFQYQWLKESSDRGVARAVADFDGDGSPDVTVDAPVTCSAGRCRVGTVVKH